MAADEQHEIHRAAPHAPVNGVVAWLERLDNWAHVVVAGFFILMATTVIVHMGFIFLRQLPLIIPPTPAVEAPARSGETSAPPASEPAPHARPEARPGASTETEHASGQAATPTETAAKAAAEAAKTAAKAEAPAANPTPRTETAASESADPFVKNSLELLSNILFVVILLELLRTIITYLETHDIQAIMQEFLVVGIISSVRKILLVGAEASLRHGANQMEFIQEASGVVVDILGILLLILGLVMLKRAFGNKTQKESPEAT